MAPPQARGSNNSNSNNAAPEPISRSSSVTVLSPVVKDGVEEIVVKLGDIDGLIEALSAPNSPEAARVPDMGELTREISKLQEEVKSVKLAQDSKIKEIREKVTEDLKNEIAESLEEDVGAAITDAVATEVEEEMEEWGSQPGVSALVNALERMVNANKELLDAGNIQLNNSLSRHVNSTVDIPDDLKMPLRKIKRQDGAISELFPESLRVLFSYDDNQLVKLLMEYNLHPLAKHSENLNRFLIFIGVNVSVPDQLVDFAEEQPPAYPTRDTTWYQDERTQRSTRRRSSASEKSAGASWFSFS